MWWLPLVMLAVAGLIILFDSNWFSMPAALAESRYDLTIFERYIATMFKATGMALLVLVVMLVFFGFIDEFEDVGKGAMRSVTLSSWRCCRRRGTCSRCSPSPRWSAA